MSRPAWWDSISAAITAQRSARSNSSPSTCAIPISLKPLNSRWHWWWIAWKADSTRTAKLNVVLSLSSARISAHETRQPGRTHKQCRAATRTVHGGAFSVIVLPSAVNAAAAVTAAVAAVRGRRRASPFGLQSYLVALNRVSPKEAVRLRAVARRRRSSSTRHHMLEARRSHAAHTRIDRRTQQAHALVGPEARNVANSAGQHGFLQRALRSAASEQTSQLSKRRNKGSLEAHLRARKAPPEQAITGRHGRFAAVPQATLHSRATQRTGGAVNWSQVLQGAPSDRRAQGEERDHRQGAQPALPGSGSRVCNRDIQ